jgi:DNA sulfur modification protein DndE
VNVETIRLSQQARDQLIRLKRWTGIKNWNVLCRWAFCTSLREQSIPPPTKILLDSSVEMTWKVFAGPYQELFTALLMARCRRDGLGVAEDVLDTQFKLHLHRGIAYLAGDRRIRSITALVSTAVDPTRTRQAILATADA